MIIALALMAAGATDPVKVWTSCNEAQATSRAFQDLTPEKAASEASEACAILVDDAADTLAKQGFSQSQVEALVASYEADLPKLVLASRASDRPRTN